jgi:hypothetical protein
MNYGTNWSISASKRCHQAAVQAAVPAATLALFGLRKLHDMPVSHTTSRSRVSCAQNNESPCATMPLLRPTAAAGKYTGAALGDATRILCAHAR